MKLSKMSSKLIGQPMFGVLDRVAKLEKDGKKFIHFELGDPDFETPKQVRDAAIDAIENGMTHYVSSSGVAELRHRICEFYGREFGFQPSIDEVVIAPGCNPLIFAILQCVIDPGENVIIADPSFPTYRSSLEFLGIEYSTVPLRSENQFNMSLTDIKNAINEKTRMIIINSPNNPTGSVMDPDDLMEIIRFAEERGIYILSDEIYSLLTYDFPPFSAGHKYSYRKNVIIISGFSKPFAMSGWRIGYMIANSELSRKISLYLETVVSCSNSFVQYAASVALDIADQYIKTSKSVYIKRRDYICAYLNSINGIRCFVPKGALYVFVDIEKTGLSGEELTDKLLDAGVVVLPGTSFGEYAKTYIRLTLTRPMNEIVDGLYIIADTINRLMLQNVPMEQNREESK